MGNVAIAAAPRYMTGGTFTPKDDRMMMQDIVTQGYIDTLWAAQGSEFQVSAGSGMNLSIAAGNAFVRGSFVADQGLYHVSSGSTLTCPVTAAHATLPRIDRVLLRVYENTHDGSGLNTARIETLDGTPTSGATLANLTGAAGVPASAVLLANLLVPANSSSISGANIQDRRIKAAVGGNSDVRPVLGELATEETLDGSATAQPTPKYALGGWTVKTNRANQAEVSYWNLFPNPPSITYEWRVKTGTSTDKQLMQLDIDGSLRLPQTTSQLVIGLDVAFLRAAANIAGTPDDFVANNGAAAAARLFNYFSGRPALGFGAAFQNAVIFNIPEASAAQATASMLFQMNTGRYGWIGVFQSRTAGNPNISSTVLLHGIFDTSQAPGVGVLSQFPRSGGGNDTFAALFNGSTPQVNVTTSATGSPGTTYWNGIVMAMGQQF